MLDTIFWDDPYIEDLLPQEILLFLYIITCPLNNIAGIFEITMKKISSHTNLSKEQVKKILNKFHNDDKIYRLDNYIFIKNYVRHNFGKTGTISPQIAKGIQTILAELPQKARNDAGNNEKVASLIIDITNKIKSYL